MKEAINNTEKMNSGNPFTSLNKEPIIVQIGENEIINAADHAAKDLRELFSQSLKEMYWTEKALVTELPKVIEKTNSEFLINMIQDHHEVTRKQIIRLEAIFETLGEEVSNKKTDAIENLIKEAERVITETDDGPVRDAGIIASLQKIEHYEIASYGTLTAFAKTLGKDDLVLLLKETLEEEKEADIKLTKAAFNAINFNAAADEIKAKNNIRGIARSV